MCFAYIIYGSFTYCNACRQHICEFLSKFWDIFDPHIRSHADDIRQLSDFLCYLIQYGCDCHRRGDLILSIMAKLYKFGIQIWHLSPTGTYLCFINCVDHINKR